MSFGGKVLLWLGFCAALYGIASLVWVTPDRVVDLKEGVPVATGLTAELHSDGSITYTAPGEEIPRRVERTLILIAVIGVGVLAELRQRGRRSRG